MYRLALIHPRPLLLVKINNGYRGREFSIGWHKAKLKLLDTVTQLIPDLVLQNEEWSIGEHGDASQRNN